MAWRYDAVICGVTATWEWAQTGTTPSDIRTITETHSVQTRQDWIYRAAFGEWVPYGSLSYPSSVTSGGSTLNYVSGSFSSTEDPRQPVGGGSEGQTQSTYGSGSANYSGSKEHGKQPVYGWVRIGSVSHGHPSSIYFDDGVVAGYLTLDRCDGSASSPSGSGSYVGQQTNSSDLGTAYYSGDVPLKATAPSSPTNFRITSQDATSVNLAWDSVSGADSYSVETYIKDTSTLVNSNYGLTSLTKFISGLESGKSYTFKLWAKNAAGNSVPVYTSTTIGSGRPQNWAWTSLVSSRNTDPNRTYYSGVVPLVVVDAKDWNDFCARINAFQTYKKVDLTTFTKASDGAVFTQTMFNQAYNAINAMKPVSNPSGHYSKLVALKDALNSIN